MRDFLKVGADTLRSVLKACDPKGMEETDFDLLCRAALWFSSYDARGAHGRGKRTLPRPVLARPCGTSPHRAGEDLARRRARRAQPSHLAPRGPLGVIPGGRVYKRVPPLALRQGAVTAGVVLTGRGHLRGSGVDPLHKVRRCVNLRPRTLLSARLCYHATEAMTERFSCRVARARERGSIGWKAPARVDRGRSLYQLRPERQTPSSSFRPVLAGMGDRCSPNREAVCPTTRDLMSGRSQETVRAASKVVPRIIRPWARCLGTFLFGGEGFLVWRCRMS